MGNTQYAVSRGRFRISNRPLCGDGVPRSAYRLLLSAYRLLLSAFRLLSFPSPQPRPFRPHLPHTTYCLLNQSTNKRMPSSKETFGL